MANNYLIQTIFTGSQSNDGTGDSIRDAFNKVNANFDIIASVANIGSGLRFTGLLDAPKTLTASTLTSAKVIGVNAFGTALAELTVTATTASGIAVTFLDNKIVVDQTSTHLVFDSTPQIKLGSNLDGQNQARAIQFANPKRDQDLVTRRWLYDNFLSRNAGYSYDTFVGNIASTSTTVEGSTLSHNVVLAPTTIQTSTNVGMTITTYLNYGSTATIDLAYQAWKNEHLTRKDYVDTKISLQGISTIDSRTGAVNPGMGMMTGALQLFRDPVETDHPNTAATKHYVDNTGPLSLSNFYVALTGNDNRIDIPPYKRGRSLAWAYRTVGKAAEAAVAQQAVSQIELGPYQKTITTDNGASPVRVVAVLDDSSNYTGGIKVTVNYDGTDGTDAFINSSIYPGLYILGVDSGAVAKIVNVVSGGGGSEYYECIPVDYALTFGTPIVNLGTPPNATTTGTIQFLCAQANPVAIPDFWEGYIFRVDQTYGGGEGIITDIGVYYDARGNVYDLFTVELDIPVTIPVDGEIPGGNWHVFANDFYVGENLKWGQNYNKTEISILVESGEYEEQYPIRLADNVSIVGNEFRRSMVKPATWPGTNRSTVSTSPWVDLFFRRDTQVDGLIVVALNTSTNNAPGGVTITPSATTNDTLTGVVNFALGGGALAQPTWKGQVFVGAGGQGEIVSTQGSVFSVNLAENSQGTRTISSTNPIISGNWFIYAPINFGYHYLRDPSRPLNLLGWESSPNYGGFRNSSAILSANKDFIRAETIQYLHTKYSGTVVYSPQTYFRELGQYVDGFAFDLLNGDVNRTLNIADGILQPDSYFLLHNQLSQIVDAVTYVGTLGSQIMANHTVTNVQSTITQIFSSLSLEAGSTDTLSQMCLTIGEIVTNTGSGYNPGKHNDQIDVFLMNDATMIRYLAGQGHGGFMKVLDPEGQIKAKSPYTQTASSFSKSKNAHVFSGGFLVDGYTGNLQMYPTQLTADNNSAGDFVYIPVSGTHLNIRAPQTPCFFVNAGIKYQVDYVANYNPTGGGANTGIAILALDPNKLGGIYTVAVAGGTGANFLPSTTIPVTISSPITPGGITAKGYVTTNGSGDITSFTVTSSGQGYRRSGDPQFSALDTIVYIVGGASLNFVIANGVIQSPISIAYGGQGYTTNTQVNIAAPGGSGTVATAHITSVDPTTGAITGITLDNGGSGYTSTPAVTFGPGGLAFNAVIKKGFIGNLPSIIETVTAGNRSMLANDFTQINDLGYGIFATNGAFIENVSMFSYYCYTSYYCLNGSQVRTITGSSAYGVYGLVSEGSNPDEVPLPVTLPDPLTQIATVYNQAPYVNIAGGNIIYVTLGGVIQYVPYNNSQLEINHNGTVRLYTIKGASLVNGFSNLYQLSLDTTGGSSLLRQVGDGTPAPIRIQTQFRLSGVNSKTITRPSTVLTLSEDPTNVYRILDYTDLGNDVALAEADQNYDYINITPYTVGSSLYRQGIGRPVIASPGTGYPDGNQTITFSAPPTVTASADSQYGIQGTINVPVTYLQIISPSATIQIGTQVTGNGIPSGTYVTFYNGATLVVGLSQGVGPVPGGTVLTFTGTTATGYITTVGGSATGITITDPGTGYATKPTYSLPATAGVSATISYTLDGMQNSAYVKVLPLGAQSIARLQSVQSGYTYQFASRGTIYNIVGYTPPSGTIPWGTLRVSSISTGTTLVNSILGNNLYAGISQASTGTITVLISTLRATSHDMVDVGTGGYASTKIPNDLYGPPLQGPYPANETKEIGKGRVYFVTADQDGNFRVGKYFSVDQGRGTVTINAPISLSGVTSLQFKKGVLVNEFSTDASMASESTSKVPVEQALVGYINARLGITKTGAIFNGALIGPGFMPLTGSSFAGAPAFSGPINMGANNITNLAGPISDTDAVNKAYVRYRLDTRGLNSPDGVSGGMMTGPMVLVPQKITTASIVLSAQATNGATLLNVNSINGVYMGMQINHPNITGGSTVTNINSLSNVITISAPVITTVASASTITVDPVYQPATKQYVDASAQLNQLRDVALTNPSNQDLLMFSNTSLSANSQQTTPIYNNAQQVVNVTLDTNASANTSSASAGGSDVSFTRTSNSLKIKIGSSVITDYHVQSAASIAQSKLNMNAAGTVSTATGVTQANRGLAVFDSNVFAATNGWVTLNIGKDLATNSLVPNSTNSYNLGSSSLKYANVYATTLNGALDAGYIGGTLPISHGGTGATSASKALQNLLDSLGVNPTPGYVLTTQGEGNYQWTAGGSGGGSGPSGTRINSQRNTTSASPGQTVFSAPTYTQGADQLRVYVNGVRQNLDNNDYAETSTTSFTMGTGLNNGDQVLAEVDGYISYTILASNTVMTPVGSITATDVQNGLSQLDSNKMPKAGGTFSGDVTMSGATLNLISGTSSKAPIYFSAGTNLSSPTSGAMEWDGSNLYITQTSGPSRQTIAYQSWVNSISATAATNNTLALRDGSGNLTANVFYGTATSANYADLAEKYESDREYQPGTVMMVGGDKEVTQVTGPDCWVLGVISTNPAHLMNAEAAGQAIALTGRVPVKLNVAVKKGDALYPDVDGGATTVSNGRHPFGFALSTTTGPGLVECAIK